MNQKQTNGWKQARLGEFLRIKHGWAFKGEFFSDSGPYVLLTPGNFNEEGGLRLKGEKEKYYTGEVPSEFILKHADLLVVMTEQAEGLLGSPAIIPEGDRYLHNQRLGLVVDIDESLIDKLFLYYLFNLREVRAQIRATANGAKVRHTSPSRIYEVKVKLPPLPYQREIASVLAAYDDLIENNTRRIKILEEMAQAIYREWFVHFRFPGHEKVKLVDSQPGKIPEGWETKMLDDLAQEVRLSIKPNGIDPETPYFGLEHLPRRSIALSEWGTPKDVQSTKLAFEERDILFGKIRPYFHKVGIAPLDGVCSSDIIVIRPKAPEYFAVVLCCVSSDTFVAHATQTSQGTKMPRANWDVLKKYPVPVPPDPLLHRFNSLIEDLVARIHNIIFHNRNLRHTRDLLLPKLVSGEVDFHPITAR